MNHPLATKSTAPIDTFNTLAESGYIHIEYGVPTAFKAATFQINSSKLESGFQQELNGFSKFLTGKSADNCHHYRPYR